MPSINPNPPIILASGSESRKIMLQDAGLIFEIITSNVDEDLLKNEMEGMPFEDQVIKLAAAKALAVRSENPCLLYTSPSPRDLSTSRMPSSA